MPDPVMPAGEIEMNLVENHPQGRVIYLFIPSFIVTLACRNVTFLSTFKLYKDFTSRMCNI